MIIQAECQEAIKNVAKMNRAKGVRALFQEDADRANKYSFTLNDLHVDLSKTHITTELIDAYANYAEKNRFQEKRDALFRGDKVNLTEDRAVLHALLRQPTNSDNLAVDENIWGIARTSRQQFFDLTSELRKRIESIKSSRIDIIHVGIGGSSLGPQLLSEALAGVDDHLHIHFVSNVDAHEVLDVLKRCDPRSTFVFGISKTFTTQETLLNLLTIKQWFGENLRTEFNQRFYAVTANSDNALEFGCHAENIVEFPEWVGGRYSVWSAVSLSVALMLGVDEFDLFLSGATEMDTHFQTKQLSENLPFLLASLDHCYVNHFDMGSRATFAYDYRLRSLVPYLQQLEMESNGKDRDLNGFELLDDSCPVIWGGVGTDMQHSTFQFLHQGTHFTHTEFILIKRAGHQYDKHHRKLLANGVAQSAALLRGRSMKELEALPYPDSVKRSKLFSGNRPSSTFVLEKLDAKSLGSLLALYEHRTYCFGLLANINSFDQMGVELGKQLADEIEPAFHEEVMPSGLDDSTLNLLSKLV